MAKHDFEDENNFSLGGSDGQEYDFSGVGSAANDEEISDVDIDDAEFFDMDGDGAPIAGSGYQKPLPNEIDLYLEQINQWKGGKGGKDKSEFVNDGHKIDAVREERLRLAAKIAEKPELIAHAGLGDAAKYLNADLNYISRSDPASSEYGEFMQRRAELRDQMFAGESMVTADDYAKIAGRAQVMIGDEAHINHQYDLLDLRKEAALEHFDDPRFVVGVHRHKKGLMDELLVDFDRKDLLKGQMDPVTKSRSQAQTDVFLDRVNKSAVPNQSPSEMVKNFQEMREVGLNIRHNQRAIAGFADAFPDDGAAFQRGLSALDNVRWSEGLFDDYVTTMSKDDKAFIKREKGPAAAFVVARKRFEEEYLRGNANAAQSFAVMEHAARKIEKSPKLQEKLAELGDVHDVASFRMLTEEFRQKNLGKETSAKVDEEVRAKMGDSLIKDGQAKRAGSAEFSDESGEKYTFKASQDSVLEVVDGAHVRMANSKEDLEAGKGVTLRLNGIVAPPEGTSTKSGKLDAGLEAKANLEGVIQRHGIASLGMRVKTLESGENVVELRTADGEDVSQRMLRDGYAMPTKDTLEGNRREYMTKQAEGNRRGLWSEGFPEMDQSWRREKDGPDMTWRDKRLHLEKTVNGALSQTQDEVARKLSRSETKMFALPVNKWAGSPAIDREISKIMARNPSRLMDIYNNNMEVLDDLRKRKDKLTQKEKVAHDQLSLGRRAIGQALVNGNLMDESQFKKDTHPLISRKGITISKDGIRTVADAALKTADVASRGAKAGAKKGKGILNYMLDEAMH